MWTVNTRSEHDREDLRYPSDLTDAEWAILEPLFPPPAKTGRKRSWPMREVINAIFFVLRGACHTANLDKIAATEHQNVICVLAAGFDLLVRGPRSAGRTS